MQQASGGGVGFLGLLTLLFVALKLTNVIDWAWKWVFTPIWVPAVVGIVVAVLGFIVFLFVNRDE